MAFIIENFFKDQCLDHYLPCFRQYSAMFVMTPLFSSLFVYFLLVSITGIRKYLQTRTFISLKYSNITDAPLIADICFLLIRFNS